LRFSYVFVSFFPVALSTSPSTDILETFSRDMVLVPMEAIIDDILKCFLSIMRAKSPNFTDFRAKLQHIKRHHPVKERDIEQGSAVADKPARRAVSRLEKHY